MRVRKIYYNNIIIIIFRSVFKYNLCLFFSLFFFFLSLLILSNNMQWYTCIIVEKYNVQFYDISNNNNTNVLREKNNIEW